jgi:DnaJ domain
MYVMYQGFVADSNGKFDPATFSLDKFSPPQVVGSAAALCRVFGRLPASQQARVLAIIPRLAGQGSAVAIYAGRTAALINSVGGNVVLVTLSAVYLSWEALLSLKQWWTGEISGKRCAKQIIDATLTLGASVGGGLAGAAIGSLVGPVGSVAGALIGGLVASYGAEKLTDWLTQKIFDLPKDVATEKAYDFLGLKPSASNSEINAAFRKLCLMYHPDKGGNMEKFLQLQTMMGIIKLHRGEA